MNENLKVGVVGCGQIAQIMHLPYLHDLEQFRIEALSDISLNLMDKLGEKFNVPAKNQFLDYNEMIDKADIDIVLVCDKNHYEPVMKAISSGKHVFVEKPLAFNVREAKEILKAKEEYEVKLMVGYMKCYDPGFVYAANRIKGMKNISLVRVHNYSGAFGHLNKIYDLYIRDDVSMNVYSDGKMIERLSMLEELGEAREELLPAYYNFLYGIVHNTVLLRHLFGEDVKVLFADVYNKSDMSVILQYGDKRVSMEIGFSDNMEIWDENIHVYSPECNLSINFPFPYLKNAPTVVNINENENGTSVNQNKSTICSFEESFRLEWLHFYDCIVNDKEPLTNIRDGLLDVKLAGDIMRAVKMEDDCCCKPKCF